MINDTKTLGATPRDHPSVSTPFYLLTHWDLRRTARIRAFFDFIIEHLDEVDLSSRQIMPVGRSPNVALHAFAKLR
jgi:predicted protein tyrosine phosphatase